LVWTAFQMAPSCGVGACVCAFECDRCHLPLPHALAHAICALCSRFCSLLRKRKCIFKIFTDLYILYYIPPLPTLPTPLIHSFVIPNEIRTGPRANGKEECIIITLMYPSEGDWCASKEREHSMACLAMRCFGLLRRFY